MHASTIALPLLAAAVAAAPLNLKARAACATANTYKVSGETISQAPAKLVTGWSCTSDSASCSLSHSETFTRTTTKTAGGGLSGTLELSKIFSAGADAGFTYSWSTSKATGSTATATCPAGGWHCGLQVITTLVTTKGQVTRHNTGPGCLGPFEQTADYTVVAPQTVPNVPSDQAAKMDFLACYINCPKGTKDCPAAAAAHKLPKCPTE